MTRELWLCATVLVCTGAWAAGKEPAPGPLEGFAVPAEQPVEATFITEYACIYRNGQTKIGVLFEIKDGWHIYAENPGDAGLPTKVSWWIKHWIPGVEIGPLHWPPHQEFIDPGGIRTFGYTGSLVLWNDLKVASHFTGHIVPLSGKVSWLACKEICIPGSTELSYGMVVGHQQVLSPDAKLFPTAE